jgi:hypothetical protein
MTSDEPVSPDSPYLFFTLNLSVSNSTEFIAVLAKHALLLSSSPSQSFDFNAFTGLLVDHDFHIAFICHVGAFPRSGINNVLSPKPPPISFTRLQSLPDSS